MITIIRIKKNKGEIPQKNLNNKIRPTKYPIVIIP